MTLEQFFNSLHAALTSAYFMICIPFFVICPSGHIFGEVVKSLQPSSSYYSGIFRLNSWASKTFDQFLLRIIVECFELRWILGYYTLNQFYISFLNGLINMLFIHLDKVVGRNW